MAASRFRIAVLLLAAAFGAGTVRAQNLLVLPFENSSHDPRLEWLGEGLAELSMDRLAGDTRKVFTREEWLATVEKVGLPSSSRFTRATMLKIAEEVDADCVIFGTYSSDGKTLTVTARVLRVDPLGLSKPLSETGGLEDLMEIHARVAWQVLNYVDSALPMSRDSFLASLERPRLDAFEQYIRGIGAPTAAQRTRYLREAARLAPDWSPPSLALGLDAFSRRDCAGALNWFARLTPEQKGGIEAAFYTGLCDLQRNEAAKAETDFAAVAEHARLAEVYNNLGVARARQDKWRDAAAAWQQAQQAEPGEPDYWFNLGLAALHNNEPAAAIRTLREALRRSPEDADARGLLILALERSGRASEAAAERENASLAAPASLPAPRWKAKLSAPLDGAGSPRSANGTHRAAHLQLHLSRGREFLAAGKLTEAQQEFSEAALIAPESPQAHVGLAEAYEGQNRREDAIRELRAALWSRDSAAVHVRLARLYLAASQNAEARAELRAALKVEPGNAEARKMLDAIESGAAGGRR